MAPEEFPSASLESVGLVGFGSGVYYGRMHAALFQWLRGLPDTPAVTGPAFVFSTSGLPFLFKLWHALLIRERAPARGVRRSGGDIPRRSGPGARTPLPSPRRRPS